MLRHLIIGPGPCNFEIHKYRLFLESLCVGKQEIGLVSDPFPKGHEIPPSSSIYTALRALFRLWVLFRLKVRHSCNFAYFDRGKGVPSFDEMMDIALVAVDFDDPTTNVRGRRALAIAKPTPRGY